MTRVNDLNKLKRYCLNQGVTLIESPDGYAHFEFVLSKNKKKYLHQAISYNKFLPKTFLINAILHEMGHREIIQNGFNKTYDKVYGKEFVKILEEMLAWQKGLEIAKKARIKINEKGYSRQASSALRTYVAELFMSEDGIKKIQDSIIKFNDKILIGVKK